MRSTICFLLAMAAVAAAGGQTYLAPKSEGVGVYESAVRQLAERPMFVVGPDSRLRLTGEARGVFKVIADDGRAGWVDRGLVAVIRPGMSVIFDSADVTDRLDEPRPIMVWGNDTVGLEFVPLERSFREQVLFNSDRETVERTVCR